MLANQTIQIFFSIMRHGLMNVMFQNCHIRTGDLSIDVEIHIL